MLVGETMVAAARGRGGSTPDLVRVGVIVGVRGVRGEVRVKSYTEAAADIAAYGELYDVTGTRSWSIDVIGEAKGLIIARLTGVADRNAAEALKGTALHVPRTALPAAAEDEYYATDLVGLTAELANGGTLGTVIAVQDFGGGVLLEVKPRQGDSVLVPFTDAVVPEVDLDGGRVVVDPPAGLLGEDAGAPARDAAEE